MRSVGCDATHLARHLDPGAVAERQVQQQQVGFVELHQQFHLAALRRLGNEFETACRLQQHGDALPHQRVIFCNNHPDHGGSFTRARKARKWARVPKSGYFSARN